MNRFATIGAACALLLGAISPALAQGQARLNAPFDVAAQRAIHGRDLPPFRGCPTPPDPIRELSRENFYSDRSSSVRDEKRFRNVLDTLEPLRRFTGLVNQIADDYVAARDADPARAACVVSLLGAWADARSGLTNVVGHAKFDMIWFVTVGSSLALLKVRDAPGLDPARIKSISAWLVALATAGSAEANTILRAVGKPHNIPTWTASAEVLSGIAANDPAVFKRGLAMIERTLDSITPEGALPAELDRKGRAFFYHIWAMDPLMLSIAAARANGIDLAARNNGAIDRLVGLILAAKKDLSLMERMAGAPQVDGPATWPKGHHEIGFAEIYLSMRDAPELDTYVRRFRPVRIPYVAGNYTLLFSRK